MKDRISFKTALVLHKTNFYQRDADAGYDINTGTPCGDFSIDWASVKAIAAPRLFELQMWLIEKHNISVSIETGWNNGHFIFYPVVWNRFQDNYNYDYFDDARKALDFGLFEALKLIKDEK